MVLIGLFARIACADPINIDSPDGAIRLTLSADGSRPTFVVTSHGAPVLDSSPLVITVDGVDLTVAATFGAPEPYELDETYDTLGVHAKATNRCKGLRIPVQQKSTGAAYTLDARAYNDGVAFRFVIPGAADKSRAPDEQTTFAIPSGSTVWYHSMRGHYEGDYNRKDISEVATGDWLAPPLTFKLPGNAGYATITEAALIGYSGMALESDGRRGVKIGLAHRQPVSYPYELRYPPEDVERLTHPASITGTITTPWRVVVIGDLNALVNTDIITSLTPPPDPKLFPKDVHTDWIKPGRAVWRYLDANRTRGGGGSGGGGAASTGATTTTTRTEARGPADPLAAPPTRPAASRPNNGGDNPGPAVPTDEAKLYTRLAAQLGFEYNLLEGFWRRWSDDQLRDVVNDGRKQNVGIFLWVHSRALRDPAARNKLFTYCHDVGIAGLKIDFFDHEHKDVIDLYQAILREGAQNHLLFDFHGANKPAGEARMWPNELTREAIRGLEASRLQNRAQHNTILPFTRYVAGHAEYTVTIFNDRRGDTSFAHQVATAAVFTAPLLTYASHPQKLLDSPAADMIKSIPSTWDQTMVLPGSGIGECAAFARRKGDTWFLAIINGPSQRTLEIPLTFLGPGGYDCLIVRDRPNESAALDVEKLNNSDSSKTFTLPLAPGGGYIARFARAAP